MSGLEITENNIPAAKAAAEKAAERALDIIGGKAVEYAVKRCPSRTSNLKNNIYKRVEGDHVLVGTEVEYAPYVELGTGKHYEPPPEWMEAHGKRGKGRDKWFWFDEKGDKKWHIGFPQKPKPFLRPAIKDHLKEYWSIIRKEFEDTNI